MAMKGPAIFLAQYMSAHPPFNNWKSVTKWAANLGFKGVQVPSSDTRCLNLRKAAESKTYAQEIAGIAKENGIEITELSSHLQGQLVAVHPAYDELFDDFAPLEVRGNPKARTEWAMEQIKLCLSANANFGCKAMPTFSGSLLWHTMYPWPQRPNQLVEEGFRELSNRWLPLLDHADKVNVDVAWEVHPGEDIHDGSTFEMFLKFVNDHPRANLLYDPSHLVLQQIDYSQYIDYYHKRIKCFHVKDAEYNLNGRTGVYGGYLPWKDRAGRFRSIGDGQVDFKRIFSQFVKYGYDGWAVLEWECCLKDPEQGAKEGAERIKEFMIKQTTKAFDDFAGGNENVNKKKLHRILGIT